MYGTKRIAALMSLVTLRHAPLRIEVILFQTKRMHFDVGSACVTFGCIAGDVISVFIKSLEPTALHRGQSAADFGRASWGRSFSNTATKFAVASMRTTRH
jgi:hypothetical protein